MIYIPDKNRKEVYHVIIDIKDFLPAKEPEDTRESSKQNKCEAEIEELIRALGVSGDYTGFCYLVMAVKIVLDNAESIQAITKEVYPDIAKYYGTTMKAVERSIRTARDVIWKSANRSTLDAIMGCHITEKPKNSKLIDGIAHYISK